jgi:response regulator RpfG family c-di-GMP phosphodiesterase
VDRSFLGNSPQAWVSEFRNAIQYKENQNIPIVVMGYNETPDYVQNTLVPGIRDYFVKPVDILLLKHNSAKISGKSSDGSDKIFELQTKSQIKLLKLINITKMSEFELEVQATSKFEVDEFVEFIADNFNMTKGGRLLARCNSCQPDASVKGFFSAQFSFVGLSPHSMNELRKWLKTQYVNAKQAGE